MKAPTATIVQPLGRLSSASPALGIDVGGGRSGVAGFDQPSSGIPQFSQCVEHFTQSAIQLSLEQGVASSTGIHSSE